MKFYKYTYLLIIGIITLISCSTYKYSLKHTEEVCFIYHPKIINDLAQDYEYMPPIDSVFVGQLRKEIDSVFLTKSVFLDENKNQRYTIIIDSIVNYEFTSYSNNISGIGTPRLNDAEIIIYSTIMDRKNHNSKRLVGKGGIATFEDQSIILPFLNVERNTYGNQKIFVLEAIIVTAYKSAKFIKKQSKK